MEGRVERAPNGRGKGSQLVHAQSVHHIDDTSTTWSRRSLYLDAPSHHASLTSRWARTLHPRSQIHPLLHQPDPANMAPPPSVRVTAVTISPESAQSLPSGELRIGPRRHKLICDEDGTLRQEFPNVLYSNHIPLQAIVAIMEEEDPKNRHSPSLCELFCGSDARSIGGSRWHSSRIQLPGYCHRPLYTPAYTPNHPDRRNVIAYNPGHPG
jgi:hypothetical protein